jgi:hypothetical protein
MVDNNHDRFWNATVLTGMFCSPDLKAEAFRNSKRDSRDRPRLSSRIDPGPAGFAWHDLMPLIGKR